MLPVFSRWSLAVGVLVLFTMADPALAQEFGRIQDTETNVAYFYFARPGEATVQVSVWGAPRPGIYEVSTGTDLDKLLSMAGGLAVGSRAENRDPPKITIRLYRPSQSREEPTFEARADRLLTGDVPYPVLQDDDIIVVETIQSRPGFGWRDALSLTTTALSLTLLVLRIRNLN